jgi:hypothetical protein
MKWDVVAMKEAVRNLRLTEQQNFCMLAQNIAVHYAEKAGRLDIS